MADGILAAGASMPAPVVVRAGAFTIACITRAAPDADDGANEDAMLILPVDADRLVLAVSDGVGGRSGGAVASRIAVEGVAAAVRAASPGVDLLAPILSGLEEANDRILALAVGAGATMTIAEINGEWIRLLNVGDSGALLFGQRGRVRLRTVHHSPTGYAVESGLLGEAQALVHRDRHILSNMLGSRDMHVEVGSAMRMGRRDTLLLASDGLFDNLLTKTIIDTARCGAPARAAARLIELAGRRMGDTGDGADAPGKPDDLTFILLRLAPRERAG
ncbi:MAG: serine/threonine-protein phosphatase [Phycisphaeraceae bacterium]|nr:serine/threonine-protein phosphatase [Phycisphaeraceae bacterium]